MTYLNFTDTGKNILQPKEAEIQKACWEWLSTIPVRTVVGYKFVDRTLQDLAYMVPNGTQLAGNMKSRARYMSSLKAQGFRSGVSDLVIAWPAGQQPYNDYCGMYIELKRNREAYKGPAAVASAVKQEQKDWLELMEGAGYWAGVAYGFEEFKSHVESYLAGKTQPELPWREKK